MLHVKLASQLLSLLKNSSSLDHYTYDVDYLKSMKAFVSDVHITADEINFLNSMKSAS
jgi:hypothetical protein